MYIEAAIFLLNEEIEPEVLYTDFKYKQNISLFQASFLFISFQSLCAKQHRIAITRALALRENVNVLLDGIPKLTVQVSTKI